MGKESLDLLPELGRRPVPRRSGIVPFQEIRELIDNGKILSSAKISDEQIQPASLDLRLGEKAYRIKASFLPSGKALIAPKIAELQLEELDLTTSAVLKPGNVYIAKAVESLALPSDMGGKANPKSTIGRLDIFTRLLTEGQTTYEAVRNGYSGDLFIEIFPRTFPIVVKTGTKLNQLRFFRGSPQFDDEHLKKWASKKPLVYENGKGSDEVVIRDGVRLSIDLLGQWGGPVAYKAKKTETPIDLGRVGAYDAEEFWKSYHADELQGSIVLHPNEFYILASREKVSIPLEAAAEMESYDPSIGEFTVHYAGFFDPGFGYGEAGEIQGTHAVLEIRAHEVPILLEHGREIGRLIYHKMADKPRKIYGSGIGSSYQNQGLSLSKQFSKVAPPKQISAVHR